LSIIVQIKCHIPQEIYHNGRNVSKAHLPGSIRQLLGIHTLSDKRTGLVNSREDGDLNRFQGLKSPIKRRDILRQKLISLCSASRQSEIGEVIQVRGSTKAGPNIGPA
jgi:hypothetical protein